MLGHGRQRVVCNRATYHVVVPPLERLHHRGPILLAALPQAVQPAVRVERHHTADLARGADLTQTELSTAIERLDRLVALRKEHTHAQAILAPLVVLAALDDGGARVVRKKREALHHAIPAGALAELRKDVQMAAVVAGGFRALRAAQVELIARKMQWRDPRRRHVRDEVLVVPHPLHFRAPLPRRVARDRREPSSTPLPPVLGLRDEPAVRHIAPDACTVTATLHDGHAVVHRVFEHTLPLAAITEIPGDAIHAARVDGVFLHVHPVVALVECHLNALVGASTQREACTSARLDEIRLRDFALAGEHDDPAVHAAAGGKRIIWVNRRGHLETGRARMRERNRSPLLLRFRFLLLNPHVLLELRFEARRRRERVLGGLLLCSGLRGLCLRLGLILGDPFLLIQQWALQTALVTLCDSTRGVADNHVRVVAHAEQKARQHEGEVEAIARLVAQD